MRFVTYRREKEERVGVHLPDGMVVDLAAARGLTSGADLGPPPTSLIRLLARWDEALPSIHVLVEEIDQQRSEGRDLSAAVYDIQQVRLLAPVPRPPRLRDYLTYEMHASRLGKVLPPAFEQMPVCYKGNPLSVIGPDETIPWPSFSNQLDFEMEIGFYVAGTGRDWSVKEAADHVAGITLFNDVSARDIQMVEGTMGIGPSKGKDFCNVMGPCMVTVDEVDEFAIEFIARVNGEEWTRQVGSARRYSFAEILAWASFCEDAVPGEFLAAGTVGGGSGAELDRWVKPGDTVELEASGVGILRNEFGQRQVAVPGAGLPSFTGAPRWVQPSQV
jgi:2-keto-4-pentenoate hydratase/2-oxohepta-3-ene-1,7-dioic acid hydratase in catechol pathway